MSRKITSDTGPAAIVPLWLLGKAEPEAITLFVALCGFELEGRWPSRTELADALGCSPDTVARWCKKLVDIGALEVERDPGGAYAYQLLRARPEARGPSAKLRTPPPQKCRGTLRKTAAPSVPIEGLDLSEGGATAPPPPLGQELTAFFVDVSRTFGGDPTPRMKGQVGREVAKLVALGKDRRVLRRAVGVLAETGKPASALEWLVGEQEREIAAPEEVGRGPQR